MNLKTSLRPESEVGGGRDGARGERGVVVVVVVVGGGGGAG